jgi:uncharacterized circularly permuted ATP-grasp superfamily protein
MVSYGLIPSFRGIAQEWIFFAFFENIYREKRMVSGARVPTENVSSPPRYKTPAGGSPLPL